MWGMRQLPKTTFLPVNPSLLDLPLPPALPVRNSRMINEAVCFNRGKCGEQHLVYSSRTRYVYRCPCPPPHSLHNPGGGGGLPARLWCPSLLGNLMDPKKNKQQSCTSECSLSGRRCHKNVTKPWDDSLSPRVLPSAPQGPAFRGIRVYPEQIQKVNFTGERYAFAAKNKTRPVSDRRVAPCGCWAYILSCWARRSYRTFRTWGTYMGQRKIHIISKSLILQEMLVIRCNFSLCTVCSSE